MLAAITIVMAAATLPPIKPEWWIEQEEIMTNREKVLKIEGILAAAGCTDAFMTAVAVVKCWPELKKAMEPELFAKRGLTGGPVEEPPLRAGPTPRHPQTAVRDINSLNEPKPAEADFEAENDANEWTRKQEGYEQDINTPEKED